MRRKAFLKKGKPNYTYPYRWTKLARQHKAENPICVACLEKGIWTPMLNADGSARGATDHIIPHRGNNRLRWDYNNLQSLCSSCHDEKTKRGE
jgi:5-methylcytosine-specific restriction protein A